MSTPKLRRGVVKLGPVVQVVWPERQKVHQRISRVMPVREWIEAAVEQQADVGQHGEQHALARCALIVMRLESACWRHEGKKAWALI